MLPYAQYAGTRDPTTQSNLGGQLAGLLLQTRRTMSTIITEACINCGACEPECPNEAISQGTEIYVIDGENCTECVGFHTKEACQAVCPVECCVPDASHPETEAVLLQRALSLHPDDAALASAASAGTFESRFRS